MALLKEEERNAIVAAVLVATFQEGIEPGLIAATYRLTITLKGTTRRLAQSRQKISLNASGYGIRDQLATGAIPG